MNVTETKSEGLSREFRVSVPKGELAAKFADKINEIQPKMNLKGFRPGKVPTAHIKKLYGKSIMADIVNDVVQETSDKALADKALRPASRPSIKLDGDQDKLISGEADLDYSMALEIMPEFEPADVSEISIERMVVSPTEDEIQTALTGIADNNKSYDKKDGKAETGDAVVIDFVGSIDGEKFDGGAAEGQTLVIGSNRFIPGFEEQLIGASAGDDINVNVSFPETYQVPTLAGKAALFEVKVHEVKAPKDAEINDEFAKTLGLDSLEALRDAVTKQLSGELEFATRQQVKRVLLDALDERHAFDLPPLMVEAEFNQIWSQFDAEKKAGRLSEEDKAKSDDELKAEYRKIAERRVRLGLVLAEVGRRADVQITNEEIVRALRQEASRYPGQEKQVIEFYTKNQGAMAQLRAPIYEEKVVDYILTKATVTDKPVTREELMKTIGDDE
ncbi:MAG: trigger factor [Rhodobacterales bacterium 12-64-8]|nr:MAG: trigger factor [Rhodobacterales bacterium 12-64-8]OYX49861.1 MAG: trigger factor [Alphaproteobacteria bacterium 32-64-14]